MSERKDNMVGTTEEKDADFSKIGSSDFLSLVSDSGTRKHLPGDQQFSGACVIKGGDRYDKIHAASNGIFGGHKNTSLDELRDKLHSIDLVEKVHRDTLHFQEHETATRIGTDIDGTIVHCRGPCIDVNKVYERDKDGDTLLHIAIIILAQDLALYFINRTPSCTWLNIQNKLLQTPLHLAVLTNQVSLVRRLVVAGADIESRDRNGNMAIHIACRYNLLNVLRSLLEPVSFEEQKKNNYDVNIQKLTQTLNSKNYEGLTCLHIANSLGHMDIVKTLTNNNADVNVKNEKSGRTILHDAAWSGNIDMVKYLISLGRRCEINAKTYDGYSAFDLARSRGHWSIVIELATAGAENEELTQDNISTLYCNV